MDAHFKMILLNVCYSLSTLYPQVLFAKMEWFENTLSKYSLIFAVFLLYCTQQTYCSVKHLYHSCILQDRGCTFLYVFSILVCTVVTELWWSTFAIFLKRTRQIASNVASRDHKVAGDFCQQIKTFVIWCHVQIKLFYWG